MLPAQTADSRSSRGVSLALQLTVGLYTRSMEWRHWHITPPCCGYNYKYRVKIQISETVMPYSKFLRPCKYQLVYNSIQHQFARTQKFTLRDLTKLYTACPQNGGVQWRQRLGTYFGGGGWSDANGKVSWGAEVTQWGPGAKTHRGSRLDP